MATAKRRMPTCFVFWYDNCNTSLAVAISVEMRRVGIKTTIVGNSGFARGTEGIVIRSDKTLREIEDEAENAIVVAVPLKNAAWQRRKEDPRILEFIQSAAGTGAIFLCTEQIAEDLRELIETEERVLELNGDTTEGTIAAYQTARNLAEKLRNGRAA